MRRLSRWTFAGLICLTILGSRFYDTAPPPPFRSADDMNHPIIQPPSHPTVATLIALSPTDDTFVRDRAGFRDTNFDEHADELLVTAQGFPEGVPVDVGYLRFDLTSVSGPVSSVRLRLYNQASPGPNITVGVYSTADDDWNGGASDIGDETTLTFNNAPTETALLDSASGSAGPAWMEFSSSTLTEYVNNQVNEDDLVTLKLKVTSTGIADINVFEDRENGGGTGNTPQLVLGCLVGDVNCDCVVDVNDITAVAAIWRARTADPTYDAQRDVNGDGIINVLDLMLVSARQGDHCEASAKSVRSSAPGCLLAVVRQRDPAMVVRECDNNLS